MSNKKTNPKNSSKAVQVAETQNVSEKAKQNDWSITEQINLMVDKALEAADHTEYGHLMTSQIVKDTLKVCEDYVRAEHPDYDWSQINGAMSFYSEHIASELLQKLCFIYKAVKR